jgi:Trypsin-like peptidase domain
MLCNSIENNTAQASLVRYSLFDTFLNLLAFAHTCHILIYMRLMYFFIIVTLLANPLYTDAAIKKTKTVKKTFDSSKKTLVQKKLSLYPSEKPIDFVTLNTLARPSIVHILCETLTGTRSLISGSGVVVSDTGIVLTNAHIAQFFLYDYTTSTRGTYSCSVRTGAPTSTSFTVQPLYVSPLWVQENLAQARAEKPKGTGENDWALLQLTLPTTYVTTGLKTARIDTRERILDTGDSGLLASFPAQFLGATLLQSALYQTTSVSKVATIYTFASNTVDLLQFKDSIVAQGGSSGGGVFNEYGRFSGIISTASDATTTKDRTVQIITTGHINRSALKSTGSTLQALIASTTLAESFSRETAPLLAENIARELFSSSPLLTK